MFRSALAWTYSNKQTAQVKLTKILVSVRLLSSSLIKISNSGEGLLTKISISVKIK